MQTEFTIGQWVRFIRKKNKLNQNDFAKKVGTQQAYVSRVENGRETVSDAFLRKVCELFQEDFDSVKADLSESTEKIKANNTAASSEDVTHSEVKGEKEEMTNRVEFLEQQLAFFQEQNRILLEMLKEKSKRPDYEGMLRKVEDKVMEIPAKRPDYDGKLKNLEEKIEALFNWMNEEKKSEESRKQAN